jgi:hypothetical protein
MGAKTQSLSFYSPETLPSRFDIVWCNFPHREHPTQPGPEPRPALVYHAGVNEADGHPYVFVHYGTSRNFDQLNPFQFIIGNYRDIGHCGLDCMTRFDLLRNVQLPWSAEYIAEKAPGAGLIVGTLPPRVIARLKEQGDALHRIAELALTRIYGAAGKHGELLQDIAEKQDEQIRIGAKHRTLSHRENRKRKKRRAGREGE